MLCPKNIHDRKNANTPPSEKCSIALQGSKTETSEILAERKRTISSQPWEGHFFKRQTIFHQWPDLNRVVPDHWGEQLIWHLMERKHIQKNQVQIQDSKAFLRPVSNLKCFNIYSLSYRGEGGAPPQYPWDCLNVRHWLPLFPRPKNTPLELWLKYNRQW